MYTWSHGDCRQGLINTDSQNLTVLPFCAHLADDHTWTLRRMHSADPYTLDVGSKAMMFGILDVRIGLVLTPSMKFRGVLHDPDTLGALHLAPSTSIFGYLDPPGE